MRFLASVSDFASVHLVVERMVLLLLPPVGELAAVLVSAPVSISLDKAFGFPLGTLLFVILEDMRLSSEVLPVMGVDTGVPRVTGITVRTPHRLEMEDVEVSIFIELVQLIHRQLILRVSKCTHVPVVAWFHFVWVSLAKLDLILLGVVELFDPVMGLRTAVPHRAFVVRLTVNHVRTDLAGVSP